MSKDGSCASAAMAMMFEQALRVKPRETTQKNTLPLLSQEWESVASGDCRFVGEVEFFRQDHPTLGAVYSKQDHSSQLYRRVKAIQGGGSWVNPEESKVVHYSSLGMVPVLNPPAELLLPRAKRATGLTCPSEQELALIDELIKCETVTTRAAWSKLARTHQESGYHTAAEYCQNRSALLSPTPIRMLWG